MVAVGEPKMKKQHLLRSTLLTAFTAFAVTCWGQTFEFNQMSYVDPGDASETQVISSRFQFDVEYAPSSSTQYYNLYVDTPHGVEWAVQNMPLLSLSDAGSGSPLKFSSYWDLGSGFETPVTGMNASALVTGSPLGQTDFGTFFGVGVGQTWRYSNGGVPSGDNFLYGNPSVYIPGAGFSANFRPTMPNITQEKNYCGPGSATNSLAWLAQQNGFTLPDTLPALQTKLAGYMGNNHDGNWDDDQVKAKLKYIKENNLPLEVHYVGGRNLPTNGNYTTGDGTARNDGRITWNWITSEMNKGQDLMFMTDKHWVVGAGFVTIGSNKYLVYRDDKYQKGADTTNAQAMENASRWCLTCYDDVNNTIDIGGWGHLPLKAVVATSPVPEPTALAVLGIGVVALLRRRKKD